MTLRKLTIDHSVRYVSKVDHSHTEQVPPVPSERERNRDRKPNMRKKNASFIKLSQKNKEVIKNITGKIFRITERTMNCFF